MMYAWIALAALVGFAGAGYQGFRMGQDNVIARQARDDQVRMETLQMAQQGAAEAIAAIEVRNVTIRQKLETRIVDNPVYRECIADDGVLQLTNEAITGRPDTPANSSVPGAGPDDGKVVR